MHRVSAADPCPVCRKPDWCLIAPDETAAICARVESARRCGAAGWLHRLADQHDRHYRTSRIVRISPPPNLSDFAERCRSSLAPAQLAGLADSLGLSSESLTALRVGWSAEHRAWTFPMLDPTCGQVVGIRLRSPRGSKFSVRGGKEGLFIPITEPVPGEAMLIAEGGTDTAALLDIGFTHVVGRPSCNGGTRQLIALIRARRPGRVVIVADGDPAGQLGAEALTTILRVYVSAVQVIAPPTGLKDARAWKQTGATRADVEAIIAASSARLLIIQTTIRSHQ
jgi:hypothetical protein